MSNLLTHYFDRKEEFTLDKTIEILDKTIKQAGGVKCIYNHFEIVKPVQQIQIIYSFTKDGLLLAHFIPDEYRLRLPYRFAVSIDDDVVTSDSLIIFSKYDKQLLGLIGDAIKRDLRYSQNQLFSD